MPVEVGDVAPDFELTDQHKQKVRLSSYRGKNVMLVFYPWAFSGICTGELCTIRDELPRFQNDDVQVVAVSCDAVHALRAFSEQQGLDYPLLSDNWPHGEVAQAYGVFNETAGAALRATFMLDREGVVRWKVVNAIGDARDAAEYEKALAGL